MVRYTMIEEILSADGLGQYISYGIEATMKDGSRDCIADVSVDREAVSQLVQLCNELELDPIHLMDVVEDFLP